MRVVKEVTLSDADFKAHKEAEAVFLKMQDRLLDKVDDVFYAIILAFVPDLDKRPDASYNWWFNNAGEAERGRPVICSDSVQDYHLEVRDIGRSELSTSQWNYFTDFPVEYMTMSRADIVRAIREDIAADEKRKAERKARANMKDAKLKAVKDAALSKLSYDERRVLGLD